MIILWFHNGESIVEKVDKNLNNKIDSLINLKSNELNEKYKRDSIYSLIKSSNIDNRIKILEMK